MRFLRESLARRGAVPCAALRGIGERASAEAAGAAAGAASGAACAPPRRVRAAVAGLVLCRQRPETAGGVVFMTLEDESGIANLIIRPRCGERARAVARRAHAVLAEGTVEHRSGVTHLLVRRLRDVGGELAAEAGGRLAQPSRDFR